MSKKVIDIDLIDIKIYIFSQINKHCRFIFLYSPVVSALVVRIGSEVEVLADGLASDCICF